MSGTMQLPDWISNGGSLKVSRHNGSNLVMALALMVTNDPNHKGEGCFHNLLDTTQIREDSRGMCLKDPTTQCLWKLIEQGPNDHQSFVTSVTNQGIWLTNARSMQ